MSASSSENTFFPLPYLSKNAVKLLALNYGECQNYDDCLEVGKTEGDKQNASATVSASAKQSASPKNDADKDNKTSGNYRRFGTDCCLD